MDSFMTVLLVGRGPLDPDAATILVRKAGKSKPLLHVKGAGRSGGPAVGRYCRRVP